ncbi:MAG TPA: hypothetical protein VFG10_14075 [Saprospiraceae bacterium]|nr:hypothetical protein [Saprospiraceae bacterium]
MNCFSKHHSTPPEQYSNNPTGNIYSSAQFNDPQGVAVDNYGRILVADTDNHRIRVITP